MTRGLRLWKGQLIDPKSGNRFRPESPGYKSLERQFPQEVAALLSGNSTPRMAGTQVPEEVRAVTNIPTISMRKSSNVYTNNDVVNTERDLLELFLPELNAQRANVRNNGVDVITDIGPIDIQYFTKPGLPFVDLISAGNFDGQRRRLGNSAIQQINRSIENDIRDGANLQDVMAQLQASNFTMYKPGKLLNTAEYPAVASVLRRNGLMSTPTVLDLAGLNKAATTTPLNQLGLGVRFNLKDNKPFAQRDTHESAFVTLSDRIANEFDITDQYFV